MKTLLMTIVGTAMLLTGVVAQVQAEDCIAVPGGTVEWIYRGVSYGDDREAAFFDCAADLPKLVNKDDMICVNTTHQDNEGNCTNIVHPGVGKVAIP
jgi:hypothetical protein